MSVVAGLDLLLDDPVRLRGRRLGFLGHPASVTRNLVPAWHALAAHPDLALVRLFGPEHGLDGAAQDMEGVSAEHDRATGLPVVSLYGSDEASLTPTAEALAGLDAVVVDLVDVGARYYTFLATIGLLLRAAAPLGIEVIVCDRPNPLGGELVEGPRLRPGIRSFVGLFDVPVVHGLTPAEFARWVVADERLDVKLTPVPMRGWERRMTWPETGMPFVPPSPNMPTSDTAVVYPGGCLVEATNLSEGRGTTRPFELVGAPWLDGAALADDMNALRLPGVRFRPVVFKPTFQKHAGKGCGGVFHHVDDVSAFRPFRTGCELLAAAARQGWGEGKMEWRAEAYEFVKAIPAVDLLVGSDELRKRLEAGRDLGDWAESWGAEEEEWRRERAEVSIYASAGKGGRNRTPTGAGRSDRPGEKPPYAAGARDASRTNPGAGVARAGAGAGALSFAEARLPAPALPSAFAVVGRHDSGKTTLLTEIVRELVSRGLRVGTAKHTPHEVPIDEPGKDSTRHLDAGASQVAFVTSCGTRLTTRTALPLDVVVRALLTEADVVLVEGWKGSSLPKIEVVRAAISREPMCAGDPTLVAIATDVPGLDAGVPTFGLGEATAIVDHLFPENRA